MSSGRELRRFAAALALLLGSGASALTTRAASDGARDPTLFSRVSLGEWRGPSNASPVALPKAPVIAWKVRVAGGIAHAPTVTKEGEILLSLTTPLLTQYDARGHLQWSARLGATPAALSPLARDDGSRLVFTEGAEAQVYSRRGRLLEKRSLPFGALDESALATALADGGLLLASGRRVARLDATLGLSFHTRTDSEVRGLFGGRAPLVVTANGAVYEIASDGALLRRATFAGRVDAVVRLGEKRVLAVLDGRRLSELDFERDTSTTRLGETDLTLYPRLAANPRGEARAIGGAEILFSFAEDGRERYRVALPSLAGAQRASQIELLLGPDGSALVAPGGSDIVSVAPDGSVARTTGTACAEPLRPAGLDATSAVFACRSGIVLLLRDAGANGPASGAGR